MVKPRVLHVHNYSNWGGNLEHVWLVLRGLERDRYDLYLAAPPGEAYPERFAALGVKVVPFEARSRSDLGAVAALASLISRHDIQLIHSHLRRTDWICGLTRLLRPGRVWVTTVHGEINRGPDFVRRATLRNRVYARVLRHAFHRVLTVSQELAWQLEHEEGVPAARLTAVPNGIEVERFSPAGPEEKEAARRDLGLAPDARVLLQSGRFGVRKGQEVLLKAAARLAGQDMGWELLFLGDGDDLERCRGLAKEMGLAERTHFLGFQADVSPCLRAADVLVMPSYSEGLPRALLEGMAAGLCPVASDISGVREALRSPECGFTFAAGDDQALAGVLATLWRDPELLRRTAARARQRVLDAYRAEYLVAAHDRCYRELLPGVGR